MSVIVKGMEIPKNCEECEFHLTEDIAFELIHQCQINRGYIDNADIHGFPHDCPLVELQEKHGRLIDENDVIDAVHERLRVLQSDKAFVKKHGDIDLLGVLPYIAKIPTVFEAEGED